MHIEGSILYLDAGSTESFQFMGAFPVLLDLGVRAVCSLESMCSLDLVCFCFLFLCSLDKNIRTSLRPYNNHTLDHPVLWLQVKKKKNPKFLLYTLLISVACLSVHFS